MPASALAALPLTAPVLLGAAGMLAVLAWRDLASRRLPNVWVGAYAASFLLYAWAAGLGWAQLQAHLLYGAIAFVVMALLFALRLMGGGDVKLWAALMLWAGPQGAVTALVIASLGGGLLGVFGWLSQRAMRRKRRPAGAPLLRMLSAARGVPYGTALAVAGLYQLWTVAMTST